MKKKLICVILIFLLVACPLLGFYLHRENNCLELSSYNYYSRALPSDFDMLRILQISDLHNKSFGKNQEKLHKLIREAEPDIVLLTGDLFDGNRFSKNKAKSIEKQPAAVLLSYLSQNYETYYIGGNHDSKVSRLYFDVTAYVEGLGIKVLHNEAVELKRGKEAINLIGIFDQGYYVLERFPEYIKMKDGSKEKKAKWKEISALLPDLILSDLKKLTRTDLFNLLMTHRPELSSLFADCDIDLMFAGHAHGGQIRLLGKYPLYTPEQGFFPQLTEGVVNVGGLDVIISRGLGNSRFPFRIENPPELVLTILHSVDS